MQQNNNEYIYQAERQKQILNYVNEKKKVTVKELSDFFGVSKVTIRRDLNELELRGLINKTHGGALSIDNGINIEIPYIKKAELYISEKKKIGMAAAQLIKNDEVIILDAGSTTLEIARHIEKKRITVITNDLKIAVELACKPNITLIITGGIVEKYVFTAIGSNTVEFISKIHANKLFLGADAISLEYGITNRTLEEVAVKKAMIKAADQVILVADHSKLDKKVFATICKIDDIDMIVIDEMQENYKNLFKERGIKILIA
ncbi:DeoR/GlpR family DNA-binding transcription regulator [Thermoanaerobacterium thermosaccharolyticum]|uniref:Transcriptional regulator of sugar metabolism n=1 Tax=Thermoanaerobacterium thermosaccharolyticum M0795 TaxID=698948 RepID=L0IF27_THETR|nr:DeoR/GlpR family DNA-binding transcription regulator [Thermoanaerobacterium thermosaccharolyticum]AGB18160.1 transcriptional regulator of sugar metabolism [Thermoanaerobacterium thermosaccharolyticum M0795]